MSKHPELAKTKQYLKGRETKDFDVFCFGLALLEMLCSELNGPTAFKHLCKISNDLGTQKILDYITNSDLRELLSKALEEHHDKRATLEELNTHQFFSISTHDN